MSVGTISRAFNGYSDINADTKQNIFTIAKELGYTPNVNARSLSSKIAPNIGLIVSGFLESDKRDNFVHQIMKGTYKYALQNSLEIALYTTDSENQRKKSYSSFCVEHSIFGVILSGITTTDAYFKELMDSGMPCVLIDVNVKGKGIGCVSIDNMQASMEMTNYLIDRNHRNIIIIAGKKDTTVNTKRIKGISKVFSDNNMKLLKKNMLFCDFSEEIAYRKTKSYILENGINAVSAFMCLSDIMALGTIKAVQELGYHIPEDVSVVGFDGIPVTEYMTPPLTTIEQDVEEMGYQAGVLLQELMSFSVYSKEVYVPYTMKERGSVRKI